MIGGIEALGVVGDEEGVFSEKGGAGFIIGTPNSIETVISGPEGELILNVCGFDNVNFRVIGGGAEDGSFGIEVEGEDGGGLIFVTDEKDFAFHSGVGGGDGVVKVGGTFFPAAEAGLEIDAVWPWGAELPGDVGIHHEEAHETGDDEGGASQVSFEAVAEGGVLPVVGEEEAGGDESGGGPIEFATLVEGEDEIGGDDGGGEEEEEHFAVVLAEADGGEGEGPDETGEDEGRIGEEVTAEKDEEIEGIEAGGLVETAAFLEVGERDPFVLGIPDEDGNGTEGEHEKEDVETGFEELTAPAA
jgi:hypothetical protein